MRRGARRRPSTPSPVFAEPESQRGRTIGRSSPASRRLRFQGFSGFCGSPGGLAPPGAAETSAARASACATARSHASRNARSRQASSALLRKRTTGTGERARRCIQPSSSSSGGREASQTSRTASAPPAEARAALFIAVPRTVRDLCRPGVSSSTSWPRASVRTPRTVVRVVCTTGLTIETFSPTRRFTSVDLPALVRPTTATTPACGAGAPALASRRRFSAASAGLFRSSFMAAILPEPAPDANRLAVDAALRRARRPW